MTPLLPPAPAGQPPTLHKLDPLRLPLQGLQVIEASAGTGKTWTLAALYVRLVLGHAPDTDQLHGGLNPPQILVMTFTEAATAELRGRIRSRLALAARYFGGQQPQDPDADAFLHDLGAAIAPQLWPLCAARLDLAAQWMDDAAIFTIHGWSSRMLKTHAFDSASLFQQSRVEDSDQLLLSAVQDYWRQWYYPLTASQLGALQGLADTPEDLMAALQPLWACEQQAPNSRTPPAQSPDVVVQAWDNWRAHLPALEAQARSACSPALLALLAECIAAKALKGYRKDWPTKLADWALGPPYAELSAKEQTETGKVLQRFATRVLLEKGWSAAADYPAFGHIQALCEHLAAQPQVATQLRAHAAFFIGAAYRQAKDRLAQFDFSDLLQHLYHALQANDRLARAIGQQYPVALVDEFQDTDPWQYGALEKIYAQPCGLPSQATAGRASALIMIGDPKQAIYSFRGADLNTYLLARQQAQAIYTLSGNYRSTAGVVAAINHIFMHASEPFGVVPYEPVSACNDQILPLQVAGEPQVAMTVWHLQLAKPLRKPMFMRHMADLFASQMVGLLQTQATEPGNMAVLVKNRGEARAIRMALANRGVRSVYLSERDSVFATNEALDLWHILRAVANPRNGQLVRAALATRVWGLPWSALETLIQNEAAWDALIERFDDWQKIWQHQGVLPMLHHLLHDQSIPARLLRAGDSARQGERQLTNVLHLGDLLQTASLALQGSGALIRYLEQQMRRPQASGDMALLRLESEARLVQVITVHKAKGLQYPLVFLPFAASYRPADSGMDDTLRLAEDIRLLYVALTRAKQALWLGITPTRGDVDGLQPKVKSALSALLGRQSPGDLAHCLQHWQSAHISVQPAPQPNDQCYQPPAAAPACRPALLPQRDLRSHWWSASFSALTRNIDSEVLHAAPQSDLEARLEDAQLDNAANAPSPVDAADAMTTSGAALASVPGLNAFPAGSHYGTLLHELLQWQADQGWPAGQSTPAAAVAMQWNELVSAHAQRLDLSPSDCALLVNWIPSLVTTRLPLEALSGPDSTLVLGALSQGNYWAEMAFGLKVGRLQSAWLDSQISQHVLPGCSRVALQQRQLGGMLTGFIDLVALLQGRYYVLDYKSNKLPGYAPADLQQAILVHRYDVQYTLYLLALHRLLKARLPDYDYDLHVGGALYLFLRGIDQAGAGVYLDCPPKALIEALDHAFAGHHDGSAFEATS